MSHITLVPLPRFLTNLYPRRRQVQKHLEVKKNIQARKDQQATEKFAELRADKLSPGIDVQTILENCWKVIYKHAQFLEGLDVNTYDSSPMWETLLNSIRAKSVTDIELFGIMKVGRISEKLAHSQALKGVFEPVLSELPLDLSRRVSVEEFEEYMTTTKVELGSHVARLEEQLRRIARSGGIMEVDDDISPSDLASAENGQLVLHGQVPKAPKAHRHSHLNRLDSPFEVAE